MITSCRRDQPKTTSSQAAVYSFRFILEALERLILPDHPIAGGGYYVIRGGNERRNRGLHRASTLHYSGIGNKAGGVVGDDEWQQIRDDVIREDLGFSRSHARWSVWRESV